MAERDPQVSFRVKPSVMATLTELAQGQSLYAYMPGFVDAALSDVQEAQQVSGELRHELSNHAATIDTLKGDIAELTAENTRLRNEETTRRNEVSSTNTAITKLKANHAVEITNARKEIERLTGELDDAQARTKRVIDVAAKNSFVSRKKLESL